jgi:hypothetical protein
VPLLDTMLLMVYLLKLGPGYFPLPPLLLMVLARLLLIH